MAWMGMLGLPGFLRKDLFGSKDQNSPDEGARVD